MGSRAIQLTLAVVLVSGAPLLGCKSADEGLLPDRMGSSGGGSGTGGRPDTDGGGGTGAMDGAVPALDGATRMDGAVSADGCVGATELCNGEDDDCDGKVDEDADDACGMVIVNARASCENMAGEAFCLNRGCLDGYWNCDGLNENGCEPYCSCHVCEDGGADDGGK